MTRLYNIIAAMLAATCAGAAVFPVSNSWYNYQPCEPIATLYTAIVERCQVAGISEPSIVQTWECSAGSSNDVFYTTNIYDGVEVVTTNWLLWPDHIVTNIVGGTTNISHYTNLCLMTANIVTTNQFGPFDYSYTSPNESGVATGYPYVTHYALDALDTRIENLIPEFVCRHVMSNDTYNAWFASCPTNFEGTHSNIIPWESKAGMFSREGIGYATNLTVDTYTDLVTGGDARFTRQPPTIDSWVLAEAHYTGAWVFVDVGQFDTRYYSTNLPYAVYTPEGTNIVQSVSITCTGDVLVVSDQSTDGASEIVSVTGTNTAMTSLWYDVGGLSVTGGTPSTGDVVAVLWKGTYPLYGDYPYRLYAEDLNERAEVLSKLITTYSDAIYFWGTNETYVGNSTTNWGMEGVARADDPLPSGSWAEAKANCVTDYGVDSRSGPEKSTRLQYDYHVYQWYYEAAARASTWRLGLAGYTGGSPLWSPITVTTNYAKEVCFYVSLLNMGYPDDTDYDFDDYGNTLLEETMINTLGLYEAVTGAASQSNVVFSSTYSDLDFPDAWPTTEPTTNDTYTHESARGYVLHTYDAYINWTNLTLQPLD